MAIQVLVPNATVSNTLPSSGWTYPGSPPFHSVVGDRNMRTRARHVHSAGGTFLSRVGMSSYTLQSNERVKAIQVLYTVGQTHPVLVSARINNHLNMGAGTWAPLPFPTNPAKPPLYISKWFERDAADNGEWTQSKLDALELYIHWRNPGGTYDARLYDIGILVDVQPQPTTQCIFPSINATLDVQRPRFLWEVFQETSALQYSYQIKVWTKAVVEGGSFDPATSTAVWTGNGTTSRKSSDMPLPFLAYGSDYYWGVKASVKFLGGLWWSEWSEPTPFSLNDLPVADAVTPSGLVANTNAPTLTGTYTDDELNVQSYSEFRVYERPGASWTGFDPDSAAARTWLRFSQVFHDDVLSTKCTTKLNDLTNYRFYYKVGHKLSNGNTLYSAWDFVNFNTDFIDPPAPTLTATIVGPDVRLNVTPVAPGGGQPDIDWFRIERAVEGGDWDVFRTGSMDADGEATTSDLLPDIMTPFEVWDHEAPSYKDVEYRAFSVSSDLDPDGVRSLPSNSVNVQIQQPVVWFKDPRDSTLDTYFPVEDEWLNRTLVKSRATKRALGRTKPIVVRGSSQDSSFGITVVVIGEEQWDRLMALVSANRTLFVQTPKGSWYADISGDIGIQDRLWDRRQGQEDLWKVTLPFQEVDYV